MKNVEKYFRKTGCIYGVSRKLVGDHWQAYAVKFTSLEDAEKWLHTEEYDFRERELVTKTQAVSEAGKKYIYSYSDIHTRQIPG